jgi:hypothetical protein
MEARDGTNGDGVKLQAARDGLAGSANLASGFLLREHRLPWLWDLFAIYGGLWS